LIGADDTRAPWVDGSVDARHAIRGIHSVTLRLRETAPTLAMLTDVLGFRVHEDSGGRTRVAVQDGRPGELLDLLHDPDAREAVNGLGTVHHVALAVDDDDAQTWYRQLLLEAGRHVTEVKDRQYFRSIYFRGPGGVLFEIATIPPGFGVDEPLDGLGRSLKLPPWEEHHRASIEAGLADVEIP
jgi:glyoxalase family protein